MTAAAETPVGVVGAGTLGLTVVQAALAAGSSVTLLVRPGTVDARREALVATLDRDVRRGRLDPVAATVRTQRLRVTADPAALAPAGIVVECVPEDVEAKRAVVATLEAVLAPRAVIASSTSSIPAGSLARDARRPERVVVAHHIWPAHRMPLVEVAFHDETSVAAKARLRSLLTRQERTVVRVADRPGFLVTRALYAYWDAAASLVCEGCPPETVDLALERFGWPMGPLRLMDATTLVSVVRVFDTLAPQVEQPWPGLAWLAAAFRAGATSIHGGPGRAAIASRAPRRGGSNVAWCTDDEIVERTVGAMAAEVDRAVRCGVAPPLLAEHAVELAFGFPRGRGGLGPFRPAVVPSLIA